MTRALFLLITLWMTLTLLLTPAHAAGESSSAGARLSADAAALTKHGHRLSGSDAGRAAGDFILNQLRLAGYEQILVQPFPVV